MAKEPDDQGKLEVSVRILGNELIGLKMIVDDLIANELFRKNELLCHVLKSSYCNLKFSTSQTSSVKDECLKESQLQ